jgi:AraC-like DNA-binding protein
MPESRQPRIVARALDRQLAFGERIGTHHHDQAQLVYPAQGLLAVTTDQGTWMAPPQRAVWVPAGADHRHHSYGITDMRAVLFEPAMARRGRPEPTVVAVSGLLRELILTLTDHVARPPAVRRRMERLAIDQLTEAPEHPLRLPEPHDDRLRGVTALLQTDPANSATLAELGRTVGASARTLSRLFHEELGMGFHQWRTQLRIHHALALLAHGHSVTRTAVASGWANPSAFIEAFTQTVGQTPGRYASELRKRPDPDDADPPS